jgi:hypothetical protein
MSPLSDYILPNRENFKSDPLGYSALAWHKWGAAITLAGFSFDLSKSPTSEDLKSPILWLTQAHAVGEAARTVLQNNPDFSNLPDSVQGVCDCQYCATGLMLVGYSLEICLKAMLIMKKGVAVYASEEKKHQHHRLEKLAEFIPSLSEKDKAILRALTHFVIWAGRYPDPGSGRVDNAEEIFAISEKYKISASDLFSLASRVMGHAQHMDV